MKDLIHTEMTVPCLNNRSYWKIFWHELDWEDNAEGINVGASNVPAGGCVNFFFFCLLIYCEEMQDSWNLKRQLFLG